MDKVLEVLTKIEEQFKELSNEEFMKLYNEAIKEKELYLPEEELLFNFTIKERASYQSLEKISFKYNIADLEEPSFKSKTKKYNLKNNQNSALAA